MSPCERSAWIRLTSIVIVFTPYFGYVLLLFRHGDASAKSVYFAFIVAATLHGLINGVAQIAAQTVFAREATDERDRAIEAWSLRVAYYVLITLLLGALSTLATLSFLSPVSAAGLTWVPTFTVASQFAFCCVVVAEGLRHLTQVCSYRIGAPA